MSIGGSFKGLIAECMFKLTNKRVVITRFFNRDKYFKIFGKYLTPSQYDFLYKNWFSVDAIEITHGKGGSVPVLYEIKSKNAKYDHIRKWKAKVTKNTLEVYTTAKSCGFTVKMATVLLHNNWDFDVRVEDFMSASWALDKPRLYDKKVAPPGHSL